MQVENAPARSASPGTLLWTAWGRTPGWAILSLHAVVAASQLSAGQLVSAIGYLVRDSATQAVCCLPAGSRLHAHGADPDASRQPTHSSAPWVTLTLTT